MFHKEQHPKFHKLQNNKNKENSKDIKEQNAAPLK
jgi:hypothetical protein